jgi:hypothetical protein
MIVDCNLQNVNLNKNTTVQLIINDVVYFSFKKKMNSAIIIFNKKQ